MAAVNAYGKQECLRTDHAFEFTNTGFQGLIVDTNFCREFTAVDGPKCYWRVARELSRVAAGATPRSSMFLAMFDGMEFPAIALNCIHT